MKKIIILICLFLNIFTFSQLSGKGKVISIKDGDTVILLVENNQSIVCRLAEIDCSEKSQAFGQNAKNFTSSLIFGKIVNYQTLSKDGYGRYVTKIYYRRQYISEALVKNGLAWFYRKYSDNLKLDKLEKLAKKKKIGLWSDINAVAPWDYRKNK